MQKAGQSLTIHCALHRNSYYQLLSLKQDSSQNRLFCVECLLPKEKGNVKQEYVDLIPLSIAINSPESMLNWMKNDTSSIYLQKFFEFTEKDLEKEFNEQVDKFDSIIKIVEQFKQQIKQKFQEYKSLQAQLHKFRESFFEKINYNKFCQLLMQLQELDKQFQSDQYTSVAKELSKTVDEMLKNNCELISKEINVINEDHAKTIINFQTPNNEQCIKQITQLFQQYESYISNLNENISTKSFSHLLSGYFSYTLEQKIERDQKKQIKQKNLIYLGSRDGLNSNAFWSKVNGKKQLLMIFKSKNNGNYIFGGYSPCQWQYNLNNYVQDDTLTSFLFSQTHNQIYPLKQDCKKYAIYCNQTGGYGPVFGGGNDIYINPDFNQGYSKLGHTYQWDQYQNKNSEHLFGGAQPNISECEIYEILFA